MELGRLGVWYGADKLNPAQWKTFIAKVESMGYGTLWYSESRGFESMSLGSYLLCNTQRLCIGSSIASIYARDAFSSFAGARTLAQISGNRFVLGLGVSHMPMVENLRGHEYGKPLSTMRNYLQRMRAAAADDDYGWPVALAALGPKMLALSRDATRGALPYNVTPEHTERAKAILGPDRWLVVEQKILLETNPSKARALARAELTRYMTLPNYRNNWLSLGFDDKDLSGNGSDRFMDAMVAWGTQADIEARIKAHFDAGATQVCIQPVHEPGDLAAAERTLQAFAPD